MKRFAGFIIPAAAGAVLLTGCFAGSASEDTHNESTAIEATSAGGVKSEDSGDKLKIVTTIFPQYDWVKNILGEKADKADITLLCESGTDMHSYQPTVDDILKISECDVFIYTGGESDEWTSDALKNVTNKDMKTLSLLETLGSLAKVEESVEGMQEDDHDHGSEEEHEELDEHVWLSLKNASVLTDSITEVLCAADSENADTYRSNAKDYKASLDALDNEYKKVTDNATVKTLVFADRFPFRYMIDDYGLDYYAAFSGCSAETEASFETIAFLSDKLDELSLKNVMTIEGGDESIARTVIDNTAKKDQQILKLNSVQSVTKAEKDAGLSYTDIMKDNLIVLEKALNN